MGLTIGRSILMGILSLTLVLFTIVFIFLNFYTPSVSGGVHEEDIEIAISPVIPEPDEQGNMPITDATGDNVGNTDSKTENLTNKGNTFYNILICGVSSGLSDTIMIASFDVKNKQAALLSVPRDTYLLSTPSTSSRKINAVYSAGYSTAKKNGKSKNESILYGMKTLSAIIKDVLGIRIHFTIYVDTAGFRELVDLVGGIEVNVPIRMYYNDPTPGEELYINLQPGLQTLNGKDAEGFARFRKAAGYDDFGRMGAQQQVITALVKKCMALPITKIKQFIDTGYKYVVTDLKTEDILYFAKEMLKLETKDIRFNTVPSEGRYIGAPAYVTLYKEETMQIVNKYHNWYTEDLTPDKFNIAEYPRINTSAVVNIDGTTMDQMTN